MDNLILSLLMIKSMTIYEIKTTIQRYLSSVCSDSLGSIQAALKKLLTNELITVNEYIDRGVTKKEYQITDTGLERFLGWIQAPMNWEKGKNMEEGRFFFLGLAPKSERVNVLEQLIESLYAQREGLFAIQRQLEADKDIMLERELTRLQKDSTLERHIIQSTQAETLEQAVLDIARFQTYMLEYGLTKVGNDITFFQEVLNKEKVVSDE